MPLRVKRAPVRDRRTCIVVGTVLTTVGFWFLWSAWEGRGGKKPWPLGPILPW
jgi:hypothetical protein